MKHKILISIGAFLVLALGVVGTMAAQRGYFSRTSVDHPAQFIQHDFIDLTKIGSISKYRSGEGHDFSDGTETCRSMKHYFTPAYTAADLQELDKQPLTQGRHLPPAPTAETGIAVYAPVDGQITEVQSEHFPVGKQVFITPDNAKGYVIRIFHVYPLDGVGKGSHVTAGQQIGNIGRLSATDISVQAGQLNGKYVSYFTVMPDTIFAAYQALGIKSRDELIFTKEFRDAHPFTCNGEEFTEQHEGGDQEVYINGWTMPTGNQGGQTNTNSNTNTSGNTNTNIPPHDVKVILFDDTTSRLISGKSVSVSAGGRTYRSQTGSDGSFVLPSSYISQQMSVAADGYQGGQLPYQQALASNEMTIRLKPQ